MARAADILEEALGLPPDERARIAARLIESLEAPGSARDVEAAWRTEVARRVKELDQGAIATVDWLEARKRILE